MAQPTNVIEAVARVMGELPAIGKNSTASSQQGGYAYRGIEAITSEAQALFAKYGVVFAPSVVSHRTEQITVNGKPWTDTFLEVQYQVYGPGGTDDAITVGPLLAIGRDNSDKGANKAMTQAFKYALLQVLCISDKKDDGDQVSHATDSRVTRPDRPYQGRTIKTAEEHPGLVESVAPGGIATKQVNFLRSMLAKQEITDDIDVNLVVGGWIGRGVDDIKTLSKAEASTAIEKATEAAQ